MEVNSESACTIFTSLHFCTTIDTCNHSISQTNKYTFYQSNYTFLFYQSICTILILLQFQPTTPIQTHNEYPAPTPKLFPFNNPTIKCHLLHKAFLLKHDCSNFILTLFKMISCKVQAYEVKGVCNGCICIMWWWRRSFKMSNS